MQKVLGLSAGRGSLAYIWAGHVNRCVGIVVALILYASIPHWYLALPVAFLGFWVASSLFGILWYGSGGEDMKWVTYENMISCFRRYYSTKERRLVTVKRGTPISVYSISPHPVIPDPPLVRRFDSIAFVSMTPKAVEVEFKGNAGTSDGVAVQGRLSVQAMEKMKCQYLNAW